MENSKVISSHHKNKKKKKKKKKIGRVETNIIYRERGKTMTDTLAIEVTTKTTRLNPEQIKLSKMTKKNGPQQLKLRMKKERKISD